MHGEQRLAGGPVAAAHEPDGGLGQPGGGEGGAQSEVVDGLGGAEGVLADAHHGGVQVPQDAGTVGEDVRPALEHEGYDAERRPAAFDDVVLGLPSLDDLTDQRGRGRPAPEAGDHPGTHLLGGDETGRGTPRLLGPGDVGGVRGRNLVPDGAVREAIRETVEEGRDGVV